MRITIIGLGLIGGSLALALKKADPSLEVTGCARRPETLRRAMEMGAIDAGASDMGQSVARADIVVAATPVLSVRDVFTAIATRVRPGCIVTDVASTKVQVMRWAAELLPAGVHFIGGHPMAGKETSGIEVAEAGLFHNTIYCLVPSPTAGKDAATAMTAFVEKTGAAPYFIKAEEHDMLVAGISHLPMLLSVMLVSATRKDPRWARMSKLAASGYRDATRLASGPSRVYADICLTNQKPILCWLDAFASELKRVRQLVETGDESLEKALAEASDARSKWLRSRQ